MKKLLLTIISILITILIIVTVVKGIKIGKIEILEISAPPKSGADKRLSLDSY